MKRVLCLHLPCLATDRLHARRDGATNADAPTATIRTQGLAARIAHVNGAARSMRLRPGQSLADAKAAVPHLVTFEDDPAADSRQLEALALWADCLSPVVHIEGDDTLLIDATGCGTLFGGEANMLRRAVAGLASQGFASRAAIADTPGAAWALAHAHGNPAIVAEPGRTAAYLSPLPVWSLRIDPATVRDLSRVGVDKIESLLYLPRASLAARFGQPLIDRLDQAFGDRPEPLVPFRPQPAIDVHVPLGDGVTRFDVVMEGVAAGLQRFCAALADRVAGVRRLFVTFDCPSSVVDGRIAPRTVTRSLNMSNPTRRDTDMKPLLRVLLENLALPGPVESIVLWSDECVPLDGWQGELFATDQADTRELGRLVDRLAVRLGDAAVVRPQLVSDHQPERAYRYLPATTDVVKRSNACDAAVIPPGPRPLRVPAQPAEVAAVSVVPDGPPISFRWRGAVHAVAGCVGPERIETGWWRGPHIQRDYYRVTTDAGLRCWLYRDRPTGRWFLHGWFD